MSTATPAWLSTLRAELPTEVVSVEPETLAEYGRDWTRVHTPRPAAIVFARNTADVARVLSVCNAARVPVVPSGGRTGYAAGAVAANGEVVLSLSRMRGMGPVDLAGATVRVEAGAVTQAVHEHAAAHGLTWPIDFASKGSSTVGGNIATNAGGVRVIRYGLTRQWVLGLEVVLASGEVLELNGALEKNNTGVDLRQLFIGSEGVLGVVTAATLKLTRLPVAATVLLFALDTLDAVVALLAETRGAGFPIGAYEFFTDACMRRLERHRGKRPPFERPVPFYVLMELEHQADARLDTWVASLFERGLVQDGVRADSAKQARELWELREGISESLAATGLPHKNDVALPVAALAEFSAELLAVFAAEYPGFEICNFGHIGDGNLHINIMKPDEMGKETFLGLTHAADERLFTLVRRHRGSISAEHGIGLLKKPHLHFTRSESEVAIMRGLKRLLDPNGILNPGKVFDLP